MAAATGRGPSVNAPLIVKVRAKLFLRQVLYAIVSGSAIAVGAGGSQSDSTVSIAFVVGFVIVGVAPLFGYGRLGRELTEAAKEDERACCEGSEARYFFAGGATLMLYSVWKSPS